MSFHNTTFIATIPTPFTPVDVPIFLETYYNKIKSMEHAMFEDLTKQELMIYEEPRFLEWIQNLPDRLTIRKEVVHVKEQSESECEIRFPEMDIALKAHLRAMKTVDLWFYNCKDRKDWENSPCKIKNQLPYFVDVTTKVAMRLGLMVVLSSMRLLNIMKFLRPSDYTLSQKLHERLCITQLSKAEWWQYLPDGLFIRRQLRLCFVELEDVFTNIRFYNVQGQLCRNLELKDLQSWAEFPEHLHIRFVLWWLEGCNFTHPDSHYITKHQALEIILPDM